MPRSTTTYRVFLSSPGDVPRERNAMLGVVNIVNGILEALLPDEGIQVQLIRWEDNVARQVAQGPQKVVNEQVDSYDIFFGVLAKRFGTPTDVAGSGTEEEFRRAHATYRKHGSPWIYFCFNTKFEPPKSPEEERQLEKVEAFKAELRTLGLCDEYDGADLFFSTALQQLLLIIGKVVAQERQARSVVPLPSARSDGSIGQPVPIGKRVKIADIGERDACYLKRGDYIGKSGMVLEARRFGPWLRGTFLFDRPLIKDDDGRYAFLQFQVTEADSQGVA